MIYPEPGLTDQYYIPWWIILIAILAGILLLTLLVCILWKVTTTDCFAFWYRKKKRKKKDTLFSTGKNKNPVLLSGHLDFTSSSRNYHPFLWLIFYHLCSVLSCNDFIISGSRSSYLPVSTPVFVLPSVISHWKPLFWLFFLLYLLHSSLFWSAAPVWVLQTQWAPPTLWDGVLPSPTGGPALGGGEAGIRTII